MAYTITVKTTGTCLAHFQTQDSYEEKCFDNIGTAQDWLIKNVKSHNGVDITVDDIAIYEEVRHPVRLVKPARSKRSLEQRIVELEQQLKGLTLSHTPNCERDPRDEEWTCVEGCPKSLKQG